LQYQRHRDREHAFEATPGLLNGCLLWTDTFRRIASRLARPRKRLHRVCGYFYRHGRMAKADRGCWKVPDAATNNSLA
jgi:hypothetical protein